ncbi:unnamed protein product [Prorocentrum cordatum]|uniref:Uncharacterized protein n=1 Tax=Prorocentrum cordatum TaxID=2364126 RepID=A0ABN9RLE2_9DINO|nr:unnamed protein product [Polarella glacialis]
MTATVITVEDWDPDEGFPTEIIRTTITHTTTQGAAATSSAGRRAPAAERQAGAAAAPRPCLRGWSEEERHLFSERRDGPGGGPALERATLASQRGRSSWLSRASRQGSAECPCTVSERACRAPAVRTCLSLGRARWNGSRRGQRPRAAPAHHEGCRAAAQPPAAGPKRPGPLAISRGGCGEQGGRRGPERGSLESAPGPRVFCRAELTTGCAAVSGGLACPPKSVSSFVPDAGSTRIWCGFGADSTRSCPL